MRTLKKWAGIALFALVTATGLAFTTNGNNGDIGTTNPPQDIVIVSVPASEAPGGRKLIAIRARDLADYIKQGAFVVPYNDEIAKIVGWEDAGTH